MRRYLKYFVLTLNALFYLLSLVKLFLIHWKNQKKKMLRNLKKDTEEEPK